MSAKVSIVVPVYNGENYIDNCVRNLKEQTYDNLEFVLVDDGSSDNTPVMCDEVAAGDDRFVVVHQKNGGLSAARNAGTAAATGDYVVYVDVDDDITPGLVSDNVEIALRSGADVVMFNFWYYNVDTDVKKDNPYSGDFKGSGEEFFHKVLGKAIKYEVFNAPWNKLYKMEFLRKNHLEFLPEFPIYEDIIFASRMLQYAEKIAVNSKKYYVYYVRSSGSLITKYVDGYFDSVTEFYDNALKYCAKYDNNEDRIRDFSELYVKLVSTNLKQISCKEGMPKKEKLALIRKICDNSKLRSALRIAHLESRRLFAKYFVLTRNARAIYHMYRFLGRK